MNTALTLHIREEMVPCCFILLLTLNYLQSSACKQSLQMTTTKRLSVFPIATCRTYLLQLQNLHSTLTIAFYTSNQLTGHSVMHMIW